jgi:FkbM family methyltransferase
MKKIFKQIISFFSRIGCIYLFSKKIVDYHDNLNNCELETNGELAFLQRNIADFKTVFDVGANVGEWSLLVNGLRPEASVYSFEPVGATYQKLASQNFNQNTKLYNLALGDSVGETEFFINADDSTLNSAYNRNDNRGASEKVKMDTVDNFCMVNKIEKIDFLKIDVEGYELAVLRGAKKMIADHKIGVVQFEYGGTYIDAHILLKDVFVLFQFEGYAVYKIYSHQVIKHDYNHVLENFQYANYIAVAPGLQIK